MDVRGTRISTIGYPCFMDISLQLSMLLFISIDLYGYPRMDFLSILDPGMEALPMNTSKKTSIVFV